MHFEQGDLLLQENDPYESFYIIKKGKVECFHGNDIFKTLNEGDALGGQEFAVNDRWTVRAVVAGPSTLISVRRQVWNTLLTAKVVSEKFRDLSSTLGAPAGS